MNDPCGELVVMLGKVQVEARFDRQDNPDLWNELKSNDSYALIDAGRVPAEHMVEERGGRVRR
jgi:hypothetical protein